LSCAASEPFVREHRDLFVKLGVSVERRDDDRLLRFTEQNLRGYQLLHVFLHGLGHHHDRMTTRSQRRASRGEHFAEIYARAYGERIWSAYFNAFPSS